MANIYYDFIYTTQEKYDALVEKESGGLYFISDSRRIYRGEELIAANNVMICDSLPDASTCVDGILYVVAADGEYTIYALDTSSNELKKISGGIPEELDISSFASDVISTEVSADSASDEKILTEKAVVDYISDIEKSITDKVNETFKNVEIGEASDADSKKFGLVFTKTDGSTVTIDLQKEAFVTTASLRNGTNDEDGKIFLDLTIVNGDTVSIDLTELTATASTVKLTRKITMTTTVGNYKKGDTVEITDLQTFLEDMMSQDENPSVTDPYVTLTASNNKEYEVGTEVTPTYSATFNAGSYSQTANNDQVSTGVTVTSWSVTDGTTTKTESSGSFDTLTVADDTNYVITATANHTAGVDNPKTYLGKEVPDLKIAEGSKSKSSAAIKGYRKQFIGYITSDASVEVTSDIIRNLQNTKKAATGAVEFTVPNGATRILVAYPASFTSNEPKFEYFTLSWGDFSGFTKIANVSVEGANGATAVEYTVYSYTPASAFQANTKYRVTIK